MIVENIESLQITFVHINPHKKTLSCVICENEYIDYHCSYQYNPACSRECYVKYNTKPCIDCQKTGLSLRCFFVIGWSNKKIRNKWSQRDKEFGQEIWNKKKKTVYNKRTFTNESSYPLKFE